MSPKKHDFSSYSHADWFPAVHAAPWFSARKKKQKKVVRKRKKGPGPASF